MDSQAFIDEWRKRSSQLSGRSDDVIFLVVTKTLEVMKAIEQPNPDLTHISRMLESLANEQYLSLQYDNQRTEWMRKLIYDLVDGIRITFIDLTLKNNQSSVVQRPNVAQPLLHSTDQSGTLAGYGQVEADETFDTSMRMPKEEPSMTNLMQSWNHQVDSSIDIGVADGKVAKRVETRKVVSTSGGKSGNGQKLGAPMKCVLCEEYSTRGVYSYVSHLMLSHQKTPKQAGVRFRCVCGHESRSTGHGRSNSTCGNISMSIVRDDEREEEEDEEKMDKALWKPPARKRGRPPGSGGVQSARALVRRENKWTMGDKNPPADLLRCVLCEEYGTRSVMAYWLHLRLKHQKTPEQAGVSFRCQCGHESRRDEHIRSKNNCGNISMRIVRDEGWEEKTKAELGDEDREETDLFDDYGMHGLETQEERESDGDEAEVSIDKKGGNGLKSSRPFVSSTIMKCVLCEEYDTRSVSGYLFHLKFKHQKTPTQAGVIFRCDCGHESRSDKHGRRNNCGYGSVRIVRDDEIEEDEEEEEIEEAGEADFSDGYDMDELGDEEEEEMESDGDEAEAVSSWSGKRSRNAKSFAPSASVMRCVLCEEYRTRNLTGYKLHLRLKHHKTPTQAGVRFRCVCGHESRSDSHVRSKNNCGNISISIIRDDGKEEEEELEEEEEEEEEVFWSAKGGKSNGQRRRNDQLFASSAVMRCVLCEDYSTRSVTGYTFHLKLKHQKTPTQAGVSFRCVCGHESRSDTHLRNTCGNISMTIIRDDEKEMDEKEGEYDREDEDKEAEDDFTDGYGMNGLAGEEEKESHEDLAEAIPTPSGKSGRRSKPRNESAAAMECVVCEEYSTRSVNRYISHLLLEHQTRPDKLGILFRCVCGHECRTDYHFRPKSNCGNISMSIIRDVEREEKRIVSTNLSTTLMECIKCEDYSTYNVGSYVNHLRLHHRITPTQAGVSFRCACGNMSRSHYHFTYDCIDKRSVTIVYNDEEEEQEEEEDGKLEKEDGRKKIEGEEDEEERMEKEGDEDDEVKGVEGQKCIYCEERPSTVYSYIDHLEHNHQTTLDQGGFSLVCSCGLRDSNVIDARHIQLCDGRSFTVEM